MPFMRPRIVADMPEPPPPTTTMSVSSVFWPPVFLTASGTRLAGSTPACLTQSETALRMASVVMVAPVTPSTAGDWAATMRPGRSSTALEPMPTVSDCFVTLMSAILSAVNVTSTVTSPWMPGAVAV